jgi:hypothetical protein
MLVISKNVEEYVVIKNVLTFNKKTTPFETLNVNNRHLSTNIQQN